MPFKHNCMVSLGISGRQTVDLKLHFVHLPCSVASLSGLSLALLISLVVVAFTSTLFMTSSSKDSRTDRLNKTGFILAIFSTNRSQQKLPN